MPNTKITIKGGKILGKGFDEAVAILPDGDYLVPFLSLASPRNPEEWRRYYFALRDIVFEEGNTGFTRAEIHNQAKYHVFSKLWKDADEKDFNVPIHEVAHASTKYLSEEGWQKYVKFFKEFALENYNCYL